MMNDMQLDTHLKVNLNKNPERKHFDLQFKFSV